MVREHSLKFTMFPQMFVRNMYGVRIRLPEPLKLYGVKRSSFFILTNVDNRSTNYGYLYLPFWKSDQQKAKLPENLLKWTQRRNEDDSYPLTMVILQMSKMLLIIISAVSNGGFSYRREILSFDQYSDILNKIY